MFTGLVEEVGKIESSNRRGSITDFVISAEIVPSELKLGDSVAVNGACLTVTGFSGKLFTVEAVVETLSRTTLGSFTKGRQVNLERAVRVGDRLGGHIVQGHVDCVGKVVSRRGDEKNLLLGIAVEDSYSKYIAEKGSVALDGVSLTVTYSRGAEFGISVIPHTIKETTLIGLRQGDAVNIETDVIAKYVEKLIGKGGSLSLNDLAGMGY